MERCPFCGENEHLQAVDDDGHKVVCIVCGTHGPWAESCDQAIANWNRRPASTLGATPVPAVGLIFGVGHRVIGRIVDPVKHSPRQDVANEATKPPIIESFDQMPPIGTIESETLMFRDYSIIAPPDDLAAARERRDQVGLPSITTAAELGEVSMEFDLGGEKPKR